MIPETIIDWAAVKTALAGAAGGVVRWATLRTNWTEGVAAVVIGAICALYLGPLVEPILEPVIGQITPGGDANGFAGFIVGLGGISLSGFLIDVIATASRKRKRDEEE